MSKLKEGIPKDIVEQLDINKKEKKLPNEGRLIVESHQAKISIPNKVRQKMKLQIGSKKCIMEYNEETKQLICQF
jgi:hypothetical protein